MLLCLKALNVCNVFSGVCREMTSDTLGVHRMYYKQITQIVFIHVLSKFWCKMDGGYSTLFMFLKPEQVYILGFCYCSFGLQRYGRSQYVKFA